MRHIDAEELIKQIEHDSKGNYGQYGDEWLFMDTICNQPTADVVEVIRCKNCIYKEECGREVLVNEYDDDKAVDITGFLFYCSYGERAK